MGRLAGRLGTLGITVVLLCMAVPAILAIAGRFQDPELIRRAGALLSALGAALVIYQAFVEARIEKSEALESRERAALSPSNLELAEKIMRERYTKRKLERLKVVVAIAMLVFVGEIMHGWGDYFYIDMWSGLGEDVQGQH